jgi:RNA polymerase-binding transcription factor DksA
MSSDPKELPPDIIDRASAAELDAMEEIVERRKRAAEAEFAEAAKRARAGKRQECTRCGGKITKERLKALPTATLCLYCSGLRG